MISNVRLSTFVKTVTLGVVVALGAIQVAEASDNLTMMPIDPIMSMTGKNGERIDGTVSFYFGNNAHPKVLKSFGDVVTNKKTNSIGKSDQDSCNWGMLAALLTLQENAKKQGGNAVINITSYYKKEVRSYDKEYECHAGSFITGVTLKGEVVTLKK